MSAHSLLRSSAVLAVLALSSACTPSVYVPVLQPAMVTVPAEVQVVGVIDRSGPKNVGEGILGTLEGVITGEGIGSDMEGRAAALDELIRTLEASPRYEVVIPNVDKKDVKSGLWDRELDFRTVKKVCRQAGCDALLSLEAFDSDSSVNFDGVPVPNTGGGQHTPTGETVTGERETRVLASWRLYDATDDRILDEVRDHTAARTWREEGASMDEVRRSLPAQDDTIRILGGQAGTAYGSRIAPTWVSVRRKYLTKGHPKLKEAKHYVRANDWEGAQEIWRSLLDHPDAKVKGSAEFNLALALEVEGALRRALTHAKEAAVLLHNGKSRSYVWILERRVDDQARLEAQLAPPPPEEERAPGAKPSADGSPKKPKPSADGGSSSGGTMTRPR